MATLPWLQDSYGAYGGGYGGYNPMPWDYAGMQRQQDAYNPIGSLIKGASAARYNLKGVNLKPMQDIASQISALGRAQYDDTDPLYQRTYEAERGQGMMDLSAAIAEAARQNRMQTRLGRGPLFDAERGGETQFRTMTKGYQDIQSTARQRAREILGAGQQAMGRTFDAYGTMTQLQDQNKKKKVYGMSNLADAIPVLGRMF